MRVLLAHNSLYSPAHGGGDKSNRLLMEALAGLGHQCRVVARLADFEEPTKLAFLAALKERGVVVQEPQPGFANFSLAGVDVHVATTNSQIRAYFANQIEAFAPDVILCSTDDPAQLLLGAALQSGRKVVYLARATLALPFGPDCAFPSTQKTDALRQVDAFVGVSQYVADYTRKWSGIPAVHVPISLMDPGPHP